MKEKNINTYINNYLKNNKLKFTEFCRLCGINRYNLIKLMNSNPYVNIIYLIRLSETLKIKPKILLKDFIEKYDRGLWQIAILLL